MNINQQRQRPIFAITPVIATLILIAGTFALAAAAGAYAFGLFGLNVELITAPSISINSGPAATVNDTAACVGANIAMSINNSGRNTTLTGLAISGQDVSNETTFLFSDNSNCTVQPLTSWMVGAGASNLTLVVYFGTAGLPSGLLFSFMITFANGQSLSGSQIAD